jgi:formyl-CoA transferase
MSPPLKGLTVLDLTLARAGPTCVRHLSDWGAEVIRIMPPDDANGEALARRDTSDYQNLHRNKRAITLDLKAPEGRAIFLKLAARADMLVENMRTPVKHRLQIAWEDLKPINPRLIYGSISGFGQTGPYAERAAVDQVIQGMGGLMSVTGEPGRGPMRVGVAISDTTAGTLLALAMMMALYERERTGEGRWVHTSLIESMLFMMDFQAARWLIDREIPAQAGNQHPTVAPQDVFATADGFVSIGAISTPHWIRLCEALERPDWSLRAEWRTMDGRRRDKEALHAAIGEETRKQSTAHWIERLEPLGLPCGPVYTLDQTFADPQVRDLGIAAPMTHPVRGGVHVVQSPLHFEGQARPAMRAAPLAGADTEDVLRGLGYGPDDIAALREKGVI